MIDAKIVVVFPRFICDIHHHLSTSPFPSFYKKTGTSLSSKSSKTEGDAILWARFETSDLNELGLGGVASRDGDAEKSVPALLLILGYANGAQVWAVAHSGEASELFSLRNGPIKVICL